MPRMKIYNVKDIVKDTVDGIYLDYAKNTFLFLVKSDVWMDEEIKSARRNEVCIHFIQKGCVDAFLLEVEDCLECSDLPFDIHEGSEDLLQSLQSKDLYSWQVVLIDKKDSVVFERSGDFEEAHSNLLKQKLSERLDQKYTSEDFDSAYSKIVSTLEPYELEQYAVFEERKKK